MRRPLLLAVAFSTAMASPAGLGSLQPLRAEKPRAADAIASFLGSLTGSSSRPQGPTCGCGGYIPQPEPTCEAEPLCGVEPTCGVDALYVQEPFCGAEAGLGGDADFGADASHSRWRMQHAPVRMRIQSHPPANVDRSFGPAHRFPPAPRLPSVEPEPKSSPVRPEPASLPPSSMSSPSKPASSIPPSSASSASASSASMPAPPVTSLPLHPQEPMPTPKSEPIAMPAPEPMPEPESLPEETPPPSLPIDPVQAAPLPRPKVPTTEPPVPRVEEFREGSPEPAPLPMEEEPMPLEEPSIPSQIVEPLPIAPAQVPAAEPAKSERPAAKLTPEPRRQTTESPRETPPRPLSNSLPYDPTDPFADPPAEEAAPSRSAPTSDRTPSRYPAGPEIPRFGEEEFQPVGTGVLVQPTSGVVSRTPAVRPALRIVPANDPSLSR